MISALRQRIETVGDLTLYHIEQFGRMGMFLAVCIYHFVKPPYRIFPVIRQIRFIGAGSIFVIGVTGAFTGMVLALQGYYTLTKFGSEDLLGSAVALSLIRELGPVLTALMVIG